MSFLDKLKAKWNEGKFVCAGLDRADFQANKKVIDVTFDLVLAYKPNAAFYKEEQLYKTVNYIKENHPDIAVILDAKRGDIASTNEAYVKAIFDDLGVDAVTVHPYLGMLSLQPFLERQDKGIFVLVKTSSPGAGEFQDLKIGNKPLYQIIAEHVVNWGKNVGVVVGATYPEELSIVRKIVGDMPILVPGIGAQGGDLKETLKNGLNSQKLGLIISSSRGIIFAKDPRSAALKLHQDIVSFLKHE